VRWLRVSHIRRHFALPSTASLNQAPHWADPLKAWGDVLAKYDEALKYAPNWKQLKEAREAAAEQKA
jgi:hypothetical protein